jgi:hypothetical protein
VSRFRIAIELRIVAFDDAVSLVLLFTTKVTFRSRDSDELAARYCDAVSKANGLEELTMPVASVRHVAGQVAVDSDEPVEVDWRRSSVWLLLTTRYWIHRFVVESADVYALRLYKVSV